MLAALLIALTACTSVAPPAKGCASSQECGAGEFCTVERTCRSLGMSEMADRAESGAGATTNTDAAGAAGASAMPAASATSGSTDRDAGASSDAGMADASANTSASNAATPDAAPISQPSAAGARAAGAAGAAGSMTPPNTAGANGGRTNLDLGEACTQGAECSSGHCVDAVCCGVMVCGQCSSCAQPGKEGTCTPVAGQDDRDSCAGRQSCAVGARSACEWTVDSCTSMPSSINVKQTGRIAQIVTQSPTGDAMMVEAGPWVLHSVRLRVACATPNSFPITVQIQDVTFTDGTPSPFILGETSWSAEQFRATVNDGWIDLQVEAGVSFDKDDRYAIVVESDDPTCMLGTAPSNCYEGGDTFAMAPGSDEWKPFGQDLAFRSVVNPQ